MEISPLASNHITVQLSDGSLFDFIDGGRGELIISSIPTTVKKSGQIVSYGLRMPNIVIPSGKSSSIILKVGDK